MQSFHLIIISKHTPDRNFLLVFREQKDKKKNGEKNLMPRECDLFFHPVHISLLVPQLLSSPLFFSNPSIPPLLPLLLTLTHWSHFLSFSSLSRPLSLSPRPLCHPSAGRASLLMMKNLHFTFSPSSSPHALCVHVFPSFSWTATLIALFFKVTQHYSTSHSALRIFQCLEKITTFATLKISLSVHVSAGKAKNEAKNKRSHTDLRSQSHEEVRRLENCKQDLSLSHTHTTNTHRFQMIMSMEKLFRPKTDPTTRWFPTKVSLELETGNTGQLWEFSCCVWLLATQGSWKISEGNPVNIRHKQRGNVRKRLVNLRGSARTLGWKKMKNSKDFMWSNSIFQDWADSSFQLQSAIRKYSGGFFLETVFFPFNPHKFVQTEVISHFLLFCWHFLHGIKINHWIFI